jgi:hypothetical protein
MVTRGERLGKGNRQLGAGEPTNPVSRAEARRGTAVPWTSEGSKMVKCFDNAAGQLSRFGKLFLPLRGPVDDYLILNCRLERDVNRL